MSGQWDPGGLKRGMVIDDIPVNGVSHEEKGFSSYQSVWDSSHTVAQRQLLSLEFTWQGAANTRC